MDDYMKGYDRLIESKKIVDQMEAEKLEAMILRKQAEAIESLRDGMLEYIDYMALAHEAQRLHQQADELERKQ